MYRFGLNKTFVIWSILILCLFGSIISIDRLMLPQIELKNGERVVINYKEKYKEKGYEATLLGDDITDDVKVTGKVNSNKLGEYELTYTVKNGFFKRKVKRYVYVSDIEKPKMSITKDDVYVCPDENVKKEKVNAKDNYDGDISSKVKVKIGKNKIIYSVTDSSGNKTTIVKKVYYKDIEKPTITLTGDAEQTIYLGKEYNDEGYTITDNCDKNIKDKVTKTGEVNVNAEGTYEIVYKATDDAGNEGVATRKVRVVDNKGVIYLTFDDGPNDGTTNVILDILKEEGVKATFFVTCNGPDYLIKREYDEGHTVALHTATHNYARLYSSDAAYFADLEQVGVRVKNITGYDSKIIRFPGGASNTISRKYSQGIMSRITREALNRGYKYYDWNISSGDAGNTTDPNVVYSNVVNSLRTDRANMVLMHDIKTYTRDALRNIIRFGKNNGYRFEKITYDTEMITQRVNN